MVTQGFTWSAAWQGLSAIAVLALSTWLVALGKRDVSIVDSLWSVMIFAAAWVYWLAVDHAQARSAIVLALAGVWATRLAIYITTRNWGHPEDRRYRAIRERNQPNFGLKSVYLVFGLQAVLAWIVSAPLLGGIASPLPIGWLGWAGAALAVFGIAFETVADFQLSRFKARPANRGKVMDGGLWRYSRHPNYFGEFCVWWGFFALALDAGAGWSIVSPLLMSVLLLKVSGVTLLEDDLSQRKPGYPDYLRNTPTFFPGPRRAAR